MEKDHPRGAPTTRLLRCLGGGGGGGFGGLLRRGFLSGSSWPLLGLAPQDLNGFVDPITLLNQDAKGVFYIVVDMSDRGYRDFEGFRGGGTTFTDSVAQDRVEAAWA